MKRIHIARDRLHEGEPAIAIDSGRPSVDFAKEVFINGPSRVVQDPRGMPTGARTRRPAVTVWIETEADIATDEFARLQR